MTQAAAATPKKRTSSKKAEAPSTLGIVIPPTGLSTESIASEDELLALLSDLGADTGTAAPVIATLNPGDVIDLSQAPAHELSMLDDLKALDLTDTAPVIPVEAAATNEDPSEIPNPVTPPAPAEPAKKAATPRPVFTTRSAKIQHKLGDKASEYLILDTKDAELTEAELSAMQAELLATLDGADFPKKVGEKATMLFGYLRNGGKLNEIMRRAFTLLIKDGELAGGDKGNLISNFLSKPYSIGTARSQATQMFKLFPVLKICHPRAGGKMVINHDSTIVAKMKAELGL